MSAIRPESDPPEHAPASGHLSGKRPGEPLRADLDLLQLATDIARDLDRGSDGAASSDSLRGREEELLLIVDSMPVLMSYVDDQRVYRFVNCVYEQWFGLPREEIVGRPMWEVLGQAAYEAIRPHLDAALQGEEVAYEAWVDYRVAGRRCINARYVPRRDRQRRVEGFFVFVQDMSHRRLAEDRLAASEAEYRALFELAGVAKARAELGTGRYTHVNRKMCEITGYTADELTRMTFVDLTHPADRVREQSMYTRLLGGEISEWMSQKRYVRKDGTVIWVEVYGTMVRDASGRPLYTTADIQDITQRKQGEDAIRRLAQFPEQNPNPVLRVGSDGSVHYVNAAASKLLFGLGWRPGRPAPGRFLDAMREAMASSAAGEFQMEYMADRVFLFTVMPILADGYANFYGREITEIRRAAEALRASEERFRVSQELSLDGFTALNAVRDPAGRIVDFAWSYVNPAAGRLLKRAPESLAGMRLLEILPGNKQNSELFDRYVRVVETGIPHDIELRYESEGIQGWFRNMAVRLGDGVAVFFNDITERKLAERRLQEANAELARSNTELEQFASIVSHDLRSPLVSMGAGVQFISEELGEKLSPEVIETLGYMRDSVAHMGRLIQCLLDYSCVGKGGLKLARCDAEALLDRVLRNLAAPLTQADAVVTRDPLPAIRADEALVMQVFQNLIENALKYRNETIPRVHVSARPAEGGWVFSVADNGIGISTEHFDRIFKVFQRLHADESRYAGLGIGLATCKKIIDRHGGRIWIESEPGRGTTFLFLLPDRTESIPPAD